ncbi:cytochrome c3 family protein [Geoalkalibacter sp.]|jgi:predicted CXXCH cytochrome family protein|uniref:cytochrome c3 family protein n=1 Tax=Geoalkalibacter sp. TaxID=3041440 RepID=UPI00272E8BE4|nr:cytochrome c3 family protein [Geoalkalibacter sp.]
MKKVVFWAAGLLFISTQALASISGTAHDLSSGGSAAFRSTNVDEICVFCHTPHAASTQVTNAPLWNRPDAAALVVGDLYQGSSLTTHSLPATVLAAVNASDARLCLSCHDGASMAAAVLVNPPNYNDSGVPMNPDGSEVAYTGTGEITGFANLYRDSQKLKDDHPIGMNYESVVTDTTGKFKNKGATGLRFFGAGENIMWCATCHNVHTHDQGEPFLAKGNSGSALCLACHDK